jgi:hypothetical protein
MDKTKTQKLAFINTLILICVALIYLGLIIIGIITSNPITGYFQDNIKYCMEVTTMGSSIILLVFTVLIFYSFETETNICGFLSILFMSMVVILTCSVHFIGITVSSTLISSNKSFESLLSLNWPSALFSLDILAWDLFFGVSFICLGISLNKYSKQGIAGLLSIISGLISILGLIALPMNNMNIRYIGIFGYTVMPLITCVAFIADMKKSKIKVENA